MTNKKNEIPDLTLDLINRAVSGDDEAILILLRRYDAVITKWATIEETDSNGNTIKRLDEDIKAEIQGKYIQVIQNWRELI
jgi:hypothetical protein